MRIQQIRLKRVNSDGIAPPALVSVGLALAILVWLLATVAAARADGGSTEVFRTKQGPYEIIVGIIPPTPAVGVVHFSVTLGEAGTGRPVTQATVNISAQGPQGSTGSTVAATNTFAASPYYDTNIAVDKPGEWQFQVAVDSPLGKEHVTFPLKVLSQAAVNWQAVASLMVALVLALPLVIVGYRSLRRQRRTR